MDNLDNLFKNGYFIKDISNSNDTNIASLSLLSAFRSYFHTSQDLTNIIRRSDFGLFQQDEVDKACGYTYAADACDAITHFQHFLELYIKDILLNENLLLVYDASRKPELLWEMVHGQPISDERLEGVSFIEFSEAIERINKYVDKLDPKYSFLKDHIGLMTRINTLRNRIAHRGAFIIRPEALDELFCQHIIPLVELINVNDSNYTNVLYNRLYLHSNINIWKELVDEYNKDTINQKKVYLLKLIAVCAYNNDIPYFSALTKNTDIFDCNSFLNNLYEEKKELIAKHALVEAEHRFGRVEKCPVCGCKSFVLEYDTDEDNNGKPRSFVYDANCHHCGFHLESDLLNPTYHGLSLPNYSNM